MKIVLLPLYVFLLSCVAVGQAPAAHSANPQTTGENAQPPEQNTLSTGQSGQNGGGQSSAGQTTQSASQSTQGAPQNTQGAGQLSLQYPITQQGAVALKDEPHHVLVFQNDYVRVYNVTVPSLDATLLHKHDLPYLYLTLGQTDVVNAVQGKPDAHLTLEDGATRYTPGGFAHLVRTESGIPFHNITIELVHPQNSPHNLGPNADARPLGACPVNNDPGNPQIPGEQAIPCFETDEVGLEMVHVEGWKAYEDKDPKAAALLVAMSNANLDVSLAGEHAAFLHGGDVLWLSPGVARRIEDFLGIKSKFLLLSFKDSGTAAKQ